MNRRNAEDYAAVMRGMSPPDPKDRVDLKPPRKPRANPKLVERMRGHYLSTFNRCVREHWTIDEYIACRNVHDPLPRLTRDDAAEIYGYSRAMFDAVNGYALTEWRLGFEDPSVTYPDYMTCKDATGNGPTHGAHFWTGTDRPFSAWRKL